MTFTTTRGALLRAGALTPSEWEEYTKLRFVRGRTVPPAYRTASGNPANPERRRLAAWLDEPVTFLRKDTMLELVSERLIKFYRGVVKEVEA